MRTLIRKLLATMEILPKKIRKSKDSKKYLDDVERLLKLNTKVRDADIVLSKLPNHGDDPAYSKLAKKLINVRESGLKKARRFASSIKDRKGLQLRVGEISIAVLQRRLKRTTSALAKKLRKRLRIVARDPEDLTELHKLREDSRRLQFTLEIDDNPETSKLLQVVKSWHDMLGAIRDSDIFLSHFKEEKDSSRIKGVLEHEKSDRRENYEKFLEIAKESANL